MAGALVPFARDGVHGMNIERGLLRIVTPFAYSDGDLIQFYFRRHGDQWDKGDLTDCGEVSMRLSFDADTEGFLAEQAYDILNLHEIDYDPDIGRLFIRDITVHNAADAASRMVQAMIAISIIT